VRPLIRGGEFAFLFAWTSFGLLAAVASIHLWLRPLPAAARDGKMATVLSGIAAFPSLALALALSAEWIRESATGRALPGLIYLMVAMRYWILLGGTLLIWSFLDLPWTAGKGMVGLVRVCHVVLWGLASALMLVGILLA
jgi:hypothetical protein